MKHNKFFGQNLVNIILEISCGIEDPEKHHQVIEVAITSFKSCFLFVILFDSYPMISASEVQMDKTFGMS